MLDLTVFFVLLGSACVKAARKMLVKLAPEVWIEFERIKKECRQVYFFSRVATSRLLTRFGSTY